jgi:hypothetical protein
LTPHADHGASGQLVQPWFSQPTHPPCGTGYQNQRTKILPVDSAHTWWGGETKGTTKKKNRVHKKSMPVDRPLRTYLKIMTGYQPPPSVLSSIPPPSLANYK